MIQLVYRERLCICGKSSEVLKQLNELSLKFKTLGELLKYYNIKMNS